jgi:hypothetical protein
MQQQEYTSISESQPLLSGKTSAFTLVLLSGVLYAFFDERGNIGTIAFLFYPIALLLLVGGLLILVSPENRKQLAWRFLGIRFALDVSFTLVVVLFTAILTLLQILLPYLLQGDIGFLIVGGSLFFAVCTSALAHWLFMHYAIRRIAEANRVETAWSYDSLILAVVISAFYVIGCYIIPRGSLLELCMNVSFRTLAYWVISLFILRTLFKGKAGYGA